MFSTLNNNNNNNNNNIFISDIKSIVKNNATIYKSININIKPVKYNTSVYTENCV